MYITKKKSKTCHSKWLPHCNISETDLVSSALACGFFTKGAVKTEGDFIACVVVIDILLSDGEILQFDDLLIIRKAK